MKPLASVEVLLVFEFAASPRWDLTDLVFRFLYILALLWLSASFLSYTVRIHFKKCIFRGTTACQLGINSSKFRCIL